MAGAPLLPSSSQYCPQQPQYNSTGGRVSRSKSSLFPFKIAACIVIYFAALVAFSVRPCMVNSLSQDEHTPIENTCPIHLTSPLHCAYTGTCLSVGQFVLYCNVLNNGKSTIPCATSKVSAIKRKSWELSGYLLLTLLLAGDVQLNPGPIVGAVGPDRHHPVAPAEAMHHYPGLDNITPGYEFTTYSDLVTTEAGNMGEFSADSPQILTTPTTILPSVVTPSMSCVPRINSASSNKLKRITQHKSCNCETAWL